MRVSIRVKGVCVGFGGFRRFPKGTFAQIVYTSAAKYPNRYYFKAKVYLFGYMDPYGTFRKLGAYYLGYYIRVPYFRKPP